MGKRRRHLFVLLFVLGLVVVSALVIANKPTKLGLDLKGGVELSTRASRPDRSKEVSGEDIDRSIEIIRERIDKLGVSEPEVARLGHRTRSRSACPTSPTPSGRSNRSAPPPSSTSTTGSRT